MEATPLSALQMRVTLFDGPLGPGDHTSAYLGTGGAVNAAATMARGIDYFLEPYSGLDDD